MSEWIVRRREAESRPGSIEELREWRRLGRISDGDLVFHPILARWLYAKEVEELRESAPPEELIPTVAESSKSALPMARPVSAEVPEETRIKSKILIGVLVGIAFAGFYYLQYQADAKHAAQQAAFLVKEQEKQRSNSQARLDLVADWNSNKDAIRAQVDSYLAKGEASLAIDLVNKYRAVASGDFGPGEAKAESAMSRARMSQSAGEREAYVSLLRRHFLDEGLDIEVSTSGTYSETLELEFILFGDVWAHKIQQGSLMPEIRSKGFQTVHMSDGYEWQSRLTP